MAIEKTNGSQRIQITVRITGIRMHIPTRPQVPVAAITRRHPTTNNTRRIRSPTLIAAPLAVKVGLLILLVLLVVGWRRVIAATGTWGLVGVGILIPVILAVIW